MEISVFHSEKPNTASVVLDLKEQISKLGKAPSFVSLHYNCSYDAETLAKEMSNICPTAFHGASSCLGAMTQDGHQTASETGAAAFCVFDPDGDYGTGCSDLGLSPKDAGANAIEKALRNAGREGELPDLVWISMTPGEEEAMLEGIESVIGSSAPIIGGSAADNDVSGSWSIVAGTTVQGNGVVASVFFSSSKISFAYQNGYAPTSSSGIVTKTDGRRVIEIDNRPAIESYQNWTQGAINASSDGADQNVLAAATLWPLGRPIKTLHGVPYYLLGHPAVVTADGSLDLFATIAPGETLVQMKGDQMELAKRAGRVMSQAVDAGNLSKEEVAGALMVYCGGCMLSVRDHMDVVVSGVNSELANMPFLGVFTFGEQGAILGEGNRHGNLMISAIVFSK